MTTERPTTTSLAANLAALEDVTARIAATDITEEQLAHSGPLLGEAAVRVHEAIQRLTGKRLQWLTAEEADGRWALGGARTYATHVAHTHRITQGSAKTDVRLARQLRDEIGEFARALRDGAVGQDHVRILARGALTSPARIAALQDPAHEDPADESARPHGAGQDDGAHDDDGEARDDGTAAPGTEPGDPAATHTGDDAQAGKSATGRSGTVEQLLLRKAQEMRPEQFRTLVRHFAMLADPEADERGYRKAQEREHFDISRTLNGYHLSGFLTEEHGQQVCTALDAVMGTPARDDRRSATQRRAQGLADMARLVLDQGLAGMSASVRPHVGVLIGPEQFREMMREAAARSRHPDGTDTSGEPSGRACPDGAPGASGSAPGRPSGVPGTPAARGSSAFGSGEQAGHGSEQTGHGNRVDRMQHPAFFRRDWDSILRSEPSMWSDGSGPVPTQVIRRMARCADVYRVLFSTENEVLNHGRDHRLFTPAQRRAIIARDRHCTYPGCTAPPVLCETHHAKVRWADDGKTDVANGALLCFHHHDLVEARRITMARRGGRWRFYRRDGTELPSDYPRDVPSTPEPATVSGRRAPWKQRE